MNKLIGIALLCVGLFFAIVFIHALGELLKAPEQLSNLFQGKMNAYSFGYALGFLFSKFFTPVLVFFSVKFGLKFLRKDKATSENSRA